MARGSGRTEQAPAFEFGRRETLQAAARLVEWAASAPSRRPDEEYIHELRVRLRRTRAVMRAFRRYYPSRADFERRVRPMRRLARALGPMRDADVTAELFADVLKGTPYPPRAVRRLLAQHHTLQERRWRRVRPALEALRRLEPADLAPPRSSKGAARARPLTRHARSTLQKRFGEVWALRTALKTRRPPDLHALRIEIKRLRYTMEAFDRILGPAGHRWGARLREMQSTLGLINDHTVALSVVEQRLAIERQPLERASLALVARIIEGRRAGHVERFRAQWEQADARGVERLIRKLARRRPEGG